MFKLDYKNVLTKRNIIIGVVSLIAVSFLSVFLFFFFRRKKEDENVEYIYSYDSVGNREDNE